MLAFEALLPRSSVAADWLEGQVTILGIAVFSDARLLLEGF